MNTIIRLSLVPISVMLAGLSGCASVKTAAATVGSSIERVAERIVHPFSPAPASRPAPAGLDDYKTRVARHVVQHDPGHSYEGRLPPMLPAIVVLEITVDENGQLTNVQVQRSRDPGASQVALAAVRRSTPLPRPQHLALASGKLTFSETFLFADRDRYQLRSLAGPQASE
jgi:protein TonB